MPYVKAPLAQGSATQASMTPSPLYGVRDPARDARVAVARGMEAIHRQAVDEGEDVRRLHDRHQRVAGEAVDQLRVPVVDERVEGVAEWRVDEWVVEADDEHARVRARVAHHVHDLL